MILNKTPMLLSALLLGALPAVAADYTAWTQKRTIALNTTTAGANVATTVTDFPVLIRLGASESAILSAGGANGSGVRFSKADNTTALPYQIESWSSTSAAIWVKVDSVKGNATTNIVLHYGNPGTVASESNGPAVFDTANGFRGVWHLASDSVGVSKDATPNRNHATQQGAATATQGIVGGARLFNASGAGDIDTVGINQTFNMSVNDRLTVSAWVRRAGANAAGSAFEGIAGVFDWNRNGTGVNNRMYSLVHNANNGFSFHVSSTGGDGANEVIVNSSIMADANWTHAAATVDGANIKVYVNGVSATQSAYTGNIYFPATLTGVGPFTIGMLDDNGSGEGQYFNGGIDEVRLSGIARTADWLKLEYENQKIVNTLANIGLPTAPGAPTGVTGVAGAANSGSITVSWTAPASNGGAGITGYKAMVVGDTAKTCSTTGTLSCPITGLTAGSSYTFVARAYNAVGGGTLSAASAPVNAPVSILGTGGLMLNVGSFNRAYSFRLSERLSGITDRLIMDIIDVSGKTVWSRSVSPSEAGGEISWNGLTSAGARASSGIYFVRVFTVTPAGKVEAVQGGVKLRD
ncbi:MAG: hypothetical protein K0Q91_197 [Fibrobacteria bacterium]|jgi:hypothetical protein|nr:hypothetical protein [Fibrobacteria bacterium]